MKLRLGPIGAIVLATWSLMAGTAQAQPTLNAPIVVGCERHLHLERRRRRRQL